MDQMTVSAVVDNVRAVTCFVNERLDALGCSERIRVQVDVAIDEIFSNIVRYAYNPETGPATVRVEVEEDPLCVVITFIDHGMPFDPLAEEVPDTTRLPKGERPICTNIKQRSFVMVAVFFFFRPSSYRLLSQKTQVGGDGISIRNST